MANKHQVLALFAKHPNSTSEEIAEALDCHSAYVRATLRRAGIPLRRGKGGRMLSLKEWEKRRDSIIERIAILNQELKAVREEIAAYNAPKRRAA